MKVVTDSSVMLSAFLDDEQEAYALWLRAQIREKAVQGIVPPLFFSETANGFLMACRRKRLDHLRLREILAELLVLPLTVTTIPDPQTTVDLAEKHTLTFYDATYLHLAISERARLATLDGALARAAQLENVYLSAAPDHRP